MKNVLLYINIVLIIAVAVLYYLLFTNTVGSSTTNKTNEPEEVVHHQPADGSSVTMAYVNLDSLRKNYEFFTEMNQLLLEKQKQHEANLRSRQARLEKKAADYQYKFERHLVTRRQAEEMQQELARDQQDLLQFQQSISGQLASEEQSMITQVYDSIYSYLRDFNKKHNFTFIMADAFGGNLLYADTSLNITQTVTKGLNKRYKGNLLDENDEEKSDEKKEKDKAKNNEEEENK